MNPRRKIMVNALERSRDLALNDSNIVNIVTWPLKARIAEPKEMAFAEEQLIHMFGSNDYINTTFQ
jgi:hypothetical protein